MAALKQRLVQNRATHRLFNAKLYLQNYEKLLAEMHERYHADLLPDLITVA